MHRSKIEWVRNPDNKTLGWVWNPITGCLNDCSYCYARRLANGRLKQKYLANQNKSNLIVRSGQLLEIADNPFYPRFWKHRLADPIEHPRPMQPSKRKGIFVCVSGDTEVSLVDGGTKQIKDIHIGDTVIGYSKGKAENSKVTAIRETHSLEVYRLRVNGNELIGSPNHPVLTPLGYKRLDKLSSGEYICLYEHTQKVGIKDPQVCEDSTELTRDRHSISSRSDRWRGNNIPQENAEQKPTASPSLPDSRDSEYGRITYQLADPDILAETSRGSEWRREALLEGASNRLRDCSLFGEVRALLGKQKIAISASKKVYPSKNIATLARATFSRNGGNLQRCSDAQFSWCRVKAIKRICKTEILYDIATTSHNFIANGIVTHNCDMSDLFGIGIPEEWTEQVMFRIKLCPYHRFYLLTKQPQNLIKWNPFPNNCFVGVSATNQRQSDNALQYLLNIKARIKYISYEPLLKPISFYKGAFLNGKPYVNWLIIGAMTGTLEDIKKACLYTDEAMKPMPYGKQWTLQPKIKWVEEIIKASDKAGIPVFLKDNLWGIFPDNEIIPSWAQMDRGKYRQEMPDVEVR